jgi:hypothetical protein
MEEKIIIERSDVENSRVDETLKRLSDESDFREGRNAPPVEQVPVSFIYRSWFNLMLAGGFGAFIAWAINEPYLSDLDPAGFEGRAILLLACVVSFTGLFIGAMEGILSKNFKRALKAGGLGFIMPLAGMIVAFIVIGLLSTILDPIALKWIGEDALNEPFKHTDAFIVMTMRRASLWVILGMTVGLGPGIGLKSKRMVLNGFLGGMLGGFIGGLLFDPIDFLLYGGDMSHEANLSRMIGFTILGLATGAFIGMVETLTRDAWLLMTKGPLKGKQFIVFKNPTTIGSSPQCEIYLFKDNMIDELHAKIHIERDGYSLEDNNSRTGVIINGIKISGYKKLKTGDTIEIGEMSFIYYEKDKTKK